MQKDSAIVVVDMLYDFIDGSLACAGASEAVEATAAFIDSNIDGDGDRDVEILDTLPVLFIRDHHPADHCSFKSEGGIWPPHCVEGTRGGEIHERLLQYVNEDLVFDKGCDRSVEQYSGFDGVNAAGQTLGEVLELLDIRNVHVTGIATEYCVRNTCEDLMKAGFKVTLHSGCIGYVDKAGHEKALEEMAAEGITVK